MLTDSVPGISGWLKSSDWHSLRVVDRSPYRQKLSKSKLPVTVAVTCLVFFSGFRGVINVALCDVTCGCVCETLLSVFRDPGGQFLGAVSGGDRAAKIPHGPTQGHCQLHHRSVSKRDDRSVNKRDDRSVSKRDDRSVRERDNRSVSKRGDRAVNKRDDRSVRSGTIGESVNETIGQAVNETIGQSGSGQ